MIQRRFLVAAAVALLGSACTTTSDVGAGSDASKRQSIDASVDAAYSRLYAQVPGSRELVGKARGVLVFPSIVSAGFGVGGSYGQGALREGGRTAGYYSTTAASVGLIAGAEAKAVYVLFMTQPALDRFHASNGWTIGADASITLVSVGADGNIDTRSIRGDVLGYTLTRGGLMANLSLDGTKVAKLDL